MSNFICPQCGINIIEGDNGHHISGCPHYPAEDFKDLSGKMLSDNVSREEADILAFALMKKERGELF